MTLPPALLQTLLRAAAQTRPDEMGCGECYERLDAFAEAHLRGQDADAAMPLLAEHLAMCGECREEFEALLAGLRAVGAAPTRPGAGASWAARLGFGRRA